MEHFENTVSSRRIHEGRIINLREDTVMTPSGREARREILEHKGAVAIVPVLDDGRVVMVRQFRKPAEAALLEIPAGGLEAGEDAAGCARRELSEECGLNAGRMEPLFSMYLAPGYSTELLHVFLANELTPTETHLDEDENVEVETFDLPALLQLIDDGGIRDAKTIAGLLALHRMQKEKGKGQK